MKQETTQQCSPRRYISPITRAVTLEVMSLFCGSERQDAIYGTETQEGNDNW